MFEKTTSIRREEGPFGASFPGRIGLSTGVLTRCFRWGRCSPNPLIRRKHSNISLAKAQKMSKYVVRRRSKKLGDFDADKTYKPIFCFFIAVLAECDTQSDFTEKLLLQITTKSKN